MTSDYFERPLEIENNIIDNLKPQRSIDMDLRYVSENLQLSHTLYIYIY